MSKQKEILEMTEGVWNKFLEIPEDEKHSDDTNDFRFHIHALQNILFAQEYKKKDDSVVFELKGSDLIHSISRTNNRNLR